MVPDGMHIPWDKDTGPTLDLQITKRLGAEDILKGNPFPTLLAQAAEPGL